VTRVVIFGATSAIAQALARRYAAESATFFLIGRNPERLAAVAADLGVRGAKAVESATADLADMQAHAALVARATTALGAVDLVVVAHGTLGDQTACVRDADLAVREITGNFLSHASILTHVANVLDAQGHGTLVVMGSVAGDRGRRANYVYGSAKAGLGAFVEGLRHRLAARGVTVVLVKPGTVDTPMTAAFPKGGWMWSTPERVADDIRAGIERGSAIVYTPWYWRWIMRIIRSLPESIFKRLSV
jgi:decaprenylphospho-beta-D-erythro-pentofuranosid-2-ulose 2-reductase